MPLDLSGVEETLLLALHFRAAESQRPDAILNDPKAIELVRKIDYPFDRFKRDPFDEMATAMRSRQIDRYAQAFLTKYPAAAVVEIGCGLGTRFSRLDNGSLQWLDLDLPKVIALRRQFFEDTPRCQMVACSVMDFAWMDLLGSYAGKPCLFLAEGVFPYFVEADVRRLVLALRDRFPGSELAFDGMGAGLLRLHNLQLAQNKFATRLHWGMRSARDLEGWGEGIRLLHEWFYFDDPEPRLGRYRLLRFIPLFGKSALIAHYQLGDVVTT